MDVLLGLVIGGCLGMINFALLQRQVNKVMQTGGRGMVIGYLGRYLLQGLVLFACLFLKGIVFFLSAVAGLLIGFYSTLTKQVLRHR
ncbi:MAG: hypothetical protein DRP75_04000 [Candidatus Omnitrophota bacterium]|nr:MAG: hypothetical protein DRP75_04000 [Candidatus Omnitrophota bacterium]